MTRDMGVQPAADSSARPAIFVLSGGAQTWEALDERPPDTKHIDKGAMLNRWSALWRSRDSLVDVGYWEFRGSMELTGEDGWECASIVLEGGGTVEFDGTTLSFGPGDVVMYDTPTPANVMHCPDGLRGFWIARFRTEADARQNRPEYFG